MEDAEAARESGNALFKAQSYAEASQKYVDAMALLQKIDAAAVSEAARQESLHKCRLNRAACLMKLQGYAAARRECEAVLRDDEAHAKAHFRLGQAAEALGELAEAQRSLTTAIRLSPQLREPREALDALKARLKARPNLDNTMQDLRIVEERALRALHHADLPRARQQMELLLKDARQHKEAHWEARALLALALLCTEAAEAEAAADYLRSAERVVGGGLSLREPSSTAAEEAGAEAGAAEAPATDRRGRAYVHLTAGAIALEGGKPADAISQLVPGLALAQELGEDQLGTRFLSQLAAAHTARHELPPAIELGTQALKAAREGNDKYSEAVAAANLGLVFRLTGNTRLAVEHLSTALGIAEALGYSNLLSVALGHYALLQLERSKKPDRVASAFAKLQRAAAISQVNGLARHAVDDQHNLHAAALRWRHGARADALAGLHAALESATALGYDAARARASAALGQAMLRGPEGQWSPAQLGEAHAHLARALPLAEATGSAVLEAEVYGSLSLYHLLSAEATAAADSDMGRLEHAHAAVFAARRARELGCAARGGGESALELTNLAVAVLSSRPPSERRAEGAEEEAEAAEAAEAAEVAEVAEARALLESAVELAVAAEDTQQAVRALLASATLCEARGETQAAAAALERAVSLHVAWQPLSTEAARLKVVYEGHHAAARWAEKLEALKALVATLPP